MAAILAVFAAILGLPLLGILTGMAQLGYYRLRHTPADDIPPFLILMLRGMILGLALIAIGTVTSHIVSR